jgi:hypothetical protein
MVSALNLCARFCIALCLLTKLAEAQSLPATYAGPLQIEKASLAADARGPTALVSVYYLLRNHSENPVQAEVRSNQADADAKTGNTAQVLIQPGRTGRVHFEYSLNPGANLFHSLRIDPTVLIDGAIYLSPVPQYDQRFVLATRGHFVGGTRQPLETSPARGPFLWRDLNMMMRPLSVHWTEQDVDLHLGQRIAGFGADDNAIVAITATNNGASPLTGLELSEEFSPAIAEPAGGHPDFTLIGANSAERGSDPLYRWMVHIDRLRSGETRTFMLKLRVRGRRLDLPPVAARLNDSIVALSTLASGASPAAPPGPNGAPATIFVQPTGWHLGFTEHDNHVKRERAWMDQSSYDASTDSVRWNDEVDLSDNDASDPYRWQMLSDVIKLPDARLLTGESPLLTVNQGNPPVLDQFRTEQVTNAGLVGYDDAIVVLRGWSFEYASGDHHVKEEALHIGTLSYDSATGTVKWVVRARFTDDNGDEPFRWQYAWRIIAIRGGHFQVITRSGTSPAASAIDIVDTGINAQMTGFEHYAVLPVGWDVEFKNHDNHVKEIGFALQNVSVPQAGHVRWTGVATLGDDSADDPIGWGYSAAIIGWNGGGFAEQTDGPVTTAGGFQGLPMSKRLSEIIVPITWQNSLMDGTEAGVDCGGDSPASCMQCLAPHFGPGTASVEPGSADQAGNYSLDSGDVKVAAMTALNEYAQANNQTMDAFYSGPLEADRYMEAVAAYVFHHMGYLRDNFTDWKGSQSAERTVQDSGSRGCGFDHCGDCEDFSFLRAALLRSLGISWSCVFSARHSDSDDQGAREQCPNPVDASHVYNLVYYHGKFRIMDGLDGHPEIGGETLKTCWNPHSTHNIFNDHYGNYDGHNLSPINNQLLMNYPGHGGCPKSSWDWRTYYPDVCP